MCSLYQFLVSDRQKCVSVRWNTRLNQLKKAPFALICSGTLHLDVLQGGHHSQWRSNITSAKMFHLFRWAVLFHNDSKPSATILSRKPANGSSDKNLCLSHQIRLLTIACVGACINIGSQHTHVPEWRHHARAGLWNHGYLMIRRSHHFLVFCTDCPHQEQPADGGLQ